MQSPPLLVSYPELEDFIKALPNDYAADTKQVLRHLHSLSLPSVTSITSLAVLFGFSPRILASMTNQPEKFYRVFRIHKGKGKYRTIQAPKVALKVIQKWLSHHISEAITYPKYVHGFVPGRSHITAAQAHVGANWVYSIDIENFFPTTSESKVEAALRGIGYSESGSKLISKLCCYTKNLSQGSPASPVLSNLVFKDLDSRIAELSSQIGVNYTRYADDLVFSGQGEFPEALLPVKAWISEAGWSVSKDKEHFAQLPKQRLKVHGLLVHESSPILTKGYRKKIRTYKFLHENNRIREDDKNRILGHLSYAKLVDSFSNQTEE
ncbi:MAG: hypothetical protein DI585_01425 [Pseudomonas fluorescens]|nr:MAG: hypothetical protein DI585_01425 [Pseudomonas fluorescens]